MGDQHPTSHGATVGIRTHADYLSRHTLALTKKSGQTGDLLRVLDTDNSTALASVTPAGTIQGMQGIQVATSSTKPAAAASARGLLWLSQGGAGVADVLEVCLKDAADAYNWKTIVTG